MRGRERGSGVWSYGTGITLSYKISISISISMQGMHLIVTDQKTGKSMNSIKILFLNYHQRLPTHRVFTQINIQTQCTFQNSSLTIIPRQKKQNMKLFITHIDVVKKAAQASLKLLPPFSLL